MKVSRPFCSWKDVEKVLNLREAQGEKELPGFSWARERFRPLDLIRSMPSQTPPS